MTGLGYMNTLRVVKRVEFGVYLDGGELGEILLPRLQVPEGCVPGDSLEVFLYHDTEHRLIATIQRPLAAVGEVGFLEVRSVNDVGAFLIWGVPKDLFVPFALQAEPMREARQYLVYVYLDRVSGRITGSSRLNRHIAKVDPDLPIGQEVSLVIGPRTEEGFRAIIDHRVWGFLYNNDLFREVRMGMKVQGFVKSVREDGKVDLCLDRPGYEKVDGVAAAILDEVIRQGGTLALSDSSPAADIQRCFGVSKKTFKKALGALFKDRKVLLEPGRILLAKPGATRDKPGSD